MHEKRTVREFFDNYATRYEAISDTRGRLFPHLINRIFRNSMQTRFAKTISGCQPIKGKTVLDVGCGSGRYSTVLAELGASRVVGVDFSEKMLKLAKDRAKRLGVADSCEFILSDLWRFRPEEMFDYSVVMGVMDYVDKAQEFVRHVFALTRGTAFFSFPLGKGLLAWLRRLRYRRRCELYLYTEHQLRGLLNQIAPGSYSMERIQRDFFVVITRNRRDKAEPARLV